MVRTPERDADPVGAIAAALESLGVHSQPAGSPVSGDRGADLIVGSADSAVVEVEAKYLAHPSPRELSSLPEQTRSSVVPLLVAERLSPAARDVLNAKGWAWLDLGGHLRMVHWPVVIDANVPPRHAGTERRGPVLATEVGLDVACALLAQPEQRLSVRQVAGVSGRSISSVHRALSGLDDAGLRNRQGSPVTPDLFWEAAGQWHPRRYSLRRVPKTTDEPERLLELGVDGGSPEPGVAGWALGGDVAARVLGAEMIASLDYPPDFYLPSESALRAALNVYEEAPFHDRAATVALPPARWACRQRLQAASGRGTQGSRWPLVHPLFVALDLAQDPARGREILATWEPDDCVAVWRD